MMLVCSFVCLALSAIPATMFFKNLSLFCVDWNQFPVLGDRDVPRVSVLIPARDEAAGIEACVVAALASENADVEVVVLDDDSTDATPDIVKELAGKDSRVRYVRGQELPEGWNGKQFACFQLAELASHDRLLFLDADVRLRCDALARLLARHDNTKVALLSAFPHQVTGTWLEKWIIPLMHFILLGYLPMRSMRQTTNPAYAAGCGQLFITRRDDYQRAGTHAAIKQSRHDGIKLPRAYRVQGMSTDVIDGTDLADCRMYVGAKQVMDGVLKNATEGIGNPKTIVPFTILLWGASCLPVIVLVLSVILGDWPATMVAAIAVVLSHLPRLVAAKLFRQSWMGATFHSLATPIFVLLQWRALAKQLIGSTVPWRGRA